MVAHWKYRQSADFSADGFLMPAYKVLDSLAIGFFVLIYLSLFLAPDTLWAAVGGIVWFLVFGTWCHFHMKKVTR